MSPQIKDFFVKPTVTLKEAMRRLSDIGEKQLFVVDQRQRLYGALSNGDIRRHILKGGHLDDEVGSICNRKPLSVRQDFSQERLREQMLGLKIEAMPVVSEDGIIVDILTWDAVFSGHIKRHWERVDIQVVIMAGGKGTRLEPFTKVLPKPLMPIGDKAVIEHIMDRFHEFSISDFLISLNYKSKVIRAYLTDLDSPYRITFFEEKEPLGTVGAIKLMAGVLKDPFIVINCDVLMDIDYGDLVRFHKESSHDLTLVTCCRRYVIPYGVCEVDGRGGLKTIVEKPQQDILVNTGLYVMSKKVVSLIPHAKKFDMNQLVEKAKKRGMSIGIFPVSEMSWQDTGQWDEYHKLMEKKR